MAGRVSVLRTKTMRFLKPTKLGAVSASWLRHEVRDNECVAKTWRYLASRMRWIGLLAGGSWAWLRAMEAWARGISIADVDAIWVMVAMARPKGGGIGSMLLLLECSWPLQKYLRTFGQRAEARSRNDARKRRLGDECSYLAVGSGRNIRICKRAMAETRRDSDC